MTMQNIKPLMDALGVWSKKYRSYGDYSVTTLIDSPRVVQLTKRYKELIKKKPEQMISAFVGSCVHSGFEDGLRLQSLIDNKYDVERTVFDKIEDRLISGQFDILMDQKHLYDIKTCKVWKKVFDPGMEDWHKQQNIYAYLLHRRGMDVKSLNIIALYLDWKSMDAARKPEMPQEPVEEYELNFWPYDKTEQFLFERINMMKDTEKTPDESLPLCTSEEMWERNSDTVYAVMVEGAARSSKNVSTFEEAKICGGELMVKGKKVYIEVRKPTRTRCESWCDVNTWCNQYYEYMNRKDASGKLVERINL